jgi:predicted nucleotidyltransferase
MADDAILTTIQRYLRALRAQGVETRLAILFGSWAHATATSLSDIDVIVLSPQFDRTISRADVDLLWRQAAIVDSRIEPIPCGERQWVEDRSSALLEIARREGRAVRPETA